MASLAPTLSSTISRLTRLHKPSLHSAITTLKNFRFKQKLSKRIRPFINSSPSSLSAHFSSAQMRSTVGSDDDLVVLGIETSCDDTAAAVVSLVFFWDVDLLVPSVLFYFTL